MLIRALRAENFLRFERLRLENLPREGILGIEGPNESGKSSIVEAALFALFGRTCPVSSRPVESYIRWGAHHLRAELEFEIPARGGEGFERLLVFREVDRLGTHWAKLLALPERNEIAVGNLQLARVLRERLGCDPEEFEQAFCHHQVGQEDGRSALVRFVEAMTGIVSVEKAVGALRGEIEQYEREYARYQRDIGRNVAQIERLSQGLSRLDDLEQNARRFADELERNQREASHLRAAIDVRRALMADRETACGRLQQLASGPVADVPAGVQELLGTYAELREREARCASDDRDEGDSFEGVVSRLQELDACFREFRELADRCERELEVVRGQLDEEDPDSPAARRARARTRGERLRRRQRRGRRVFAGLSAAFALLAGVAALFAVSPAAGRWVEEPRLVTSVCSGLAAVGLVALIFQGARLSTLRRELGETRESADALGGRVDELEAQRSRCERLLEHARAHRLREFVEEASEVPSQVFAGKVQEFRERWEQRAFPAPGGGAGKGGDGGKGGKGGGVGRILGRAARKERQARDRGKKRLEAETSRLEELESRAKKAQSERDRCENEIRECRAQESRKEEFVERNHELEAKAGEKRERIEERRTACELLEEATATIRIKIGPTLTGLVRSVLPELTAGRYRDVRVSDQLEVEVFAGDRSDFVPPEELSGGTNEGLLLALRLVFAQAFLSARGRRPSCVLLDEPFKALDGGRVLDALAVLRRLGPDLRQFLICQPSFTAAQRDVFDALVTTSLEATHLEREFVASAQPT